MGRAKAIITILNSEGYRVLFLAIAASLIWHIFWLSVIKVVTASDTKSPVRFSRVSFLGPILTKDDAGLRVQPKELSFLEKRYFKTIGTTVSPDIGLPGPRDYAPDSDTRQSGEDGMASLVANAVSGEKLEPGHASERRRFV